MAAAESVVWVTDIAVAAGATAVHERAVADVAPVGYTFKQVLSAGQHALLVVKVFICMLLV